MSVELTRIIRFGLVGASNTLVTIALFTLLTAARVPAPLASAAGFAAGAANGYRLNSIWTFRGCAGGRRTMLRYTAVQLVGAVLSGVGVALASSDLELHHLLAEIAVLPFVTLITYTLSSRLVFVGPEPA